MKKQMEKREDERFPAPPHGTQRVWGEFKIEEWREKSDHTKTAAARRGTGWWGGGKRILLGRALSVALDGSQRKSGGPPGTCA